MHSSMSYFSCYPLVWMCLSRIKNNKINHLHERRVRLMCKDKQPSFYKVLEEMDLFQYMNKTYVSLEIEIFNAMKCTVSTLN